MPAITEITLPIQEPTAEAKAIFDGMADAGDWKERTSVFRTVSKEEADVVADVLDFYTGGHVILLSGTGPDLRYVLWSEGYYAYIGA